MINLNDFIIEKLKVSTNTVNEPWEWEPTSEVVDYYDLVDLFKGKDKYDLLNFLGEDELPQFRLEGYPEGGIAPGTKFEDLPDDFECPLCGVGKDEFSEEK